MAYSTDGSVHTKSIENENNLKLELESLDNEDQLKIFGEKIESVTHLGGTRNKADIILTTESGKIISISDKSKKNIKTGSYDYVNTSQNIQNLFPNCYDVYKQGKESLDNKFKQIMVDTISSELNNIDNNVLTDFIFNNVIYHYLDTKVCFTDIKTKTSYLFNGEDFEFIRLYKEGYKFKIKTSNAQSKKILLFKDDIEIDSGLRFRLTLNNGKSLWIKSVNGRSSILSIKIQQDKVDRIIPNNNFKIERKVI
jgi:hypothetical protein